MARTSTGSVTQRGNRWRASVARLDDPSKRVEASFATEAEGWKWVKREVARRANGLEPKKPARRVIKAQPRKAGAATQFEEVALAWYQERYVTLLRAEADRATSLWRDVEIHLYPAFFDLFELSLSEGRSLIIGWVRASAGHQPVTKGSRFAARARGLERSTVTSLLWTLQMIVDHARKLELDVPDFLGDGSIHAMDRRGKTERSSKLVTLDETVQLASQMQIVHQFVLWTMRLMGMRISETYGL